MLTAFDWILIALYFVVTLAIGLWGSRRARTSADEYFLSGRTTSWWLAGTSMVATTFAADTPLAVTGLVARNGIAGNWIWWSFVMSGMLTVFLYARLWHRAEVMTDVELAELRYSGRPAAFLRGFRALYLALPINCIVIGWVNLAMLKILQATLGLSSDQALQGLALTLALTVVYTSLSGFRGVLLTDFFQFGLAMAMVLLLAYFAVDHVGGLTALQARVRELDASTGGGSRLAFFPEADSAWMPLGALLAYLSVNWWASWYPGAEPGGGGYVAQRIFSTRDERHGLLATLWFNLAHYCLRTWPWVLTALATAVLYPTLEDKESGYLRILMDPAVFPPSLRGLMLAAFLAAYMSTISTQLNWGASYLVNDFYRRFVRPAAGDRELVRAGRAATALTMLLAFGVTLKLGSIAGAWKLLLVTGAGTGGVLLLRWYWWRINAWSEIAAMTAAAAFSLYLQLVVGWDSDRPSDFAHLMFLTTAGTMAVMLAVTWLTPPEPRSTLAAFHARVRPAGPGWGPFTRGRPEPLAPLVADWLMGCALVFGALIGTGKLLFGEWALGIAGLLIASAASAWFALRLGRAQGT